MARQQSAQKTFIAKLAETQQFPDDPVTHFDGSNQNQHIEDQFTNLIPHDRSSCHGDVTKSGWSRGKLRKDHSGENNDTALQTDGSIAFQKRYANTAGGLSYEAG